MYIVTKLAITRTFSTCNAFYQKCGISNSPVADWLWKDCDDVPDETVDNEWDPYDDALTDADMLELLSSNSEDEEKS